MGPEVVPARQPKSHEEEEGLHGGRAVHAIRMPIEQKFGLAPRPSGRLWSMLWRLGGSSSSRVKELHPIRRLSGRRTTTRRAWPCV
jgi:hypothetical protein